MSTTAEIVIVGAFVAMCLFISFSADRLRKKASRLLDDMRREDEEERTAP